MNWLHYFEALAMGKRWAVRRFAWAAGALAVAVVARVAWLGQNGGPM